MKNSRMLTSNVLFVLIIHLSASGLTTQATEPSCTHVADFDNCLGNAHGFCPRGIACGCKDQRPFCKCPTYHSGWENYWYMGPKCDQLWSTLDLILVVAVPGVALALAASVTMQWISYCRSRPRDGAGERSTHARRHRPQIPYNPANVTNPTDNSRSISQQTGKKDDGAAPYVRFPKFPVPSYVHEQPSLPAKVGGFSYIPLQRAVPVERGRLANQLDSQQSEIPNVDYEDINPFSAMQMQQFPKAVPSTFPRFD